MMTTSRTAIPFANTYWVVPGRLLAGEHPGDVDDNCVEMHLRGLLEAGIRTFVDLTEEHETKSYSILLHAFAAEQGLKTTYLRMSIRDWGLPTEGKMRSILQALDQSIAEQQPVFVHCFAGLGRTGTVVGCYLQRHGLTTAENVIIHIAELRQRMPSGMLHSPQTSGQVRMVQHWPREF
jgi:protein tyrosine/serine phosphatase